MTSKLVGSRPIRMWIHGKCFDIKKFEGKKVSSKKKKIEPSEHNNTFEKVYYQAEEFYTVSNENGKYSTKFKLPETYYRRICNIPEFDINELASQTNSEIILPNNKDEEHLMVNSENLEDLYKTVDELHSVIAHIRKQSMALQFLCIPCQDDVIKEKFQNLKKEILELKDIEGIHESIFMAPEKLHLTIVVLVLLDEAEKVEAINTLHEYKESTLMPILQKTGPIAIEISGLDCMKHNAKKVDVLYAKAKMTEEHAEHSLQSIVNNLSNHFYNTGFLKEHQENVKLHMTVINTKYRKLVDTSRRKRPKRISIDATTILEKFKDYHFGTFNFDSIHLSHMTLRGEDGFYKPLAVVKLT